MENDSKLSLREVCTHYNIETSFLHSLNNMGLLEIIKIEETEFLDSESLHDIEMMIRLHYDLNINLEGLDAISHMLKRIKEMQREMIALRNRLDRSW